jgi:4-alpha-glucanotransferase
MSMRRRSGVLAPLFSLTSTRSWGIGEFADLPAFAQWAKSAGQSFVQILPITEIPEIETSPYSALTAMALDPIYISLPALEDFSALGGESWMSNDDKAAVERMRRVLRVDRQEVRPFKTRWLRRAFERFVDREIGGRTTRATQFAEFVQEEAWWLDDFTLFQAIRSRYASKPWWEWPEPLAKRDPKALADARAAFAPAVEYLRYVQWVAANQWADARRACDGMQIFGDIPFMISADSPDVWTQQNEFRLDATVGVPPDAFSDTGQDWGLPPWRWDVMARDGYEWMGRRARRTAALFDGFRLDHLVGLYRTYVRPIDKSVRPFFAPDEELQQLQLGERLVSIYQETGAEIVAEDLGTVPDFVRRSLQRMNVPGFRVLRWEREWTVPGQPFVDPPSYPEGSVATTGTHDIEPLARWWETAPLDERDRLIAMPSVQRHLSPLTLPRDLRAADTMPRELIDAVLQALLDAGSRLTIIPVQDIFGWRDRINTPAVVDETNWTWRLPWPVDKLGHISEAAMRARHLAEWTKAARRC